LNQMISSVVVASSTSRRRTARLTRPVDALVA
jgi:hypothetical protein